MQNITILMIVIPVILGIVSLFVSEYWNREEIFFSTIIISFILCLFGRFTIWILDEFNQYKTAEIITYSEEYELRCLDDYIVNGQKSSSTGTFLICGGYYSSNLETTQTYNIKYIYKNNEGIYKIDGIKDINIDKVGFVTDGNNTLEKKYKQKVSKHNGIYAWLYNKETESYYSDTSVIEYIFHIPVNSIIDSKDIDLK